MYAGGQVRTSTMLYAHMHNCTFNLSYNYFLCAFYLCIFVDRPRVRSLNSNRMHDMYHDQNQTRTNACAIATQACMQASMHEKAKFDGARPRERIRDRIRGTPNRWQKNNRAPLFAKSATKYEQPQRVRFLCFQQNTFLLASAFGHHCQCFWASARDASACVSLSSLASSWL